MRFGPMAVCVGSSDRVAGTFSVVRVSSCGGVSEVVLQALNNKRAARKGLNIALSYKVLRVLAYRFAESFLREF